MTTTLTGRLVLDDEVVAGRLVLDGDTIVAVEPDPTDDAASTGSYIAPGFVDLHVHGYGGHDAMGGGAALDGMARALLGRGVTSFLPTAVTAALDTLDRFVADVRAWTPGAPSDGADPLGFNLEGPFISPRRPGAQNQAHIASPVDVPRSRLEGWLDGWRITTVAPEVEGGLQLIRWLHEHGVVPSLGHSAATTEEARAGYAAGASTTTHLFNAMTGVDHRSPGLAVAALLADDAAVELIADGQHVHRELWPLILRAKPAGRLVLVSDALSISGTGETRAEVGGVPVRILGDRCTVDGTTTLAGSVIALDSAVRNLVALGVPLPTAVAAASRDPLAVIGVADRGRLAPGQRADLVELDGALRVLAVTRAGVRQTS
jgi:N-acetylglucosamine-6-phosphate deacetylase